MAKEATGRKLNVRVKLNNVRASYLHVFKKHQFEDNDPKYSGTFIIDPKSREAKKNLEDLNNAIDDVIDATFNGKEPKEIYCEALKGEDEWKGMLIVKSSNHNRPKILDQRREPLHEEDGKPYSGCYVNVILDVYGQTKYKSVQATLMGVQFLRDGDPLSGGQISDDEFDEVDEEDDSSSKRGRSSGGRSRDRDDADDSSRSRGSRNRDDDRGGDDSDSRRPSRDRNRDDADEAPRRSSRRDEEEEAPRRSSSRSSSRDEEEAPRRGGGKRDFD